MSEAYTTCPICDRTIDPNERDAVLAEKVDQHAGFGQALDLIWTPAGYAHEECLVGARGYRPVAARPPQTAGIEGAKMPHTRMAASVW